MSSFSEDDDYSVRYFYDGFCDNDSGLSMYPESEGSGEYTLPWLVKEAATTNADNPRPKVLIVGAGIGGLTLAALLQHTGYDFEIFEREHEIQPSGSALSLGSSVKGIFQQLGIFEEFQNLGKPVTSVETFNHNLKTKVFQDWTERIALSGSFEYIISRPDLHGLLYKLIPPEKIHMGKKALRFMQDEDGVTIQTWDKKFHKGDILVGADGVYSAVRQSMFKQLKDEKKLPLSDDTPIPFNCVCLMGQTKELDPEEFPDLKKETCQFLNIYGSDENGEYSLYRQWVTFTTKQNTLCWMVIQYLNKDTAKLNDAFKKSSWGKEDATMMSKQVRHLKVPGGSSGKVLTIGDLIDRSNEDLISKVSLQEKVFDTWYHGRAVLIGDACHKMNPAGGAGASSAIHDAITLANWLNILPSPSLANLDIAFKEYYKERYPAAKEAFARSQTFSKLSGKVACKFM
ncbi:hypothetical protein CPC16_011825 [Podila verticillata]|nr:hypothetical protein CPC16_011825 [Podila verticillata]